MTKTYVPNAVITIHRVNGKIERIPVLCEMRDGKIAPGPCYTEEEWRSKTSADWEYDEERGLLWQGQPGGPYNFAEYEIREPDLGSGITDEQIDLLRADCALSGDIHMSAICAKALGCDYSQFALTASERGKVDAMTVDGARAECERVIEAARAARS